MLSKSGRGQAKIEASQVYRMTVLNTQQVDTDTHILYKSKQEKGATEVRVENY